MDQTIYIFNELTESSYIEYSMKEWLINSLFFDKIYNQM